MVRVATSQRAAGLFLVSVLAIGLIAACAPRPVELIPRKVLFGLPDRTHPLISPDGRYITYLASHEDVLNIWVRSVDGEDDRPLTSMKQNTIRYYLWSYNGTDVLYIQFFRKSFAHLLYAVDVNTGESRLLTPVPETVKYAVEVRLLDMIPDRPDEVLVQMNLRDPSIFDAYRLNIRTGEHEFLYEGDRRTLWWIADRDLNVRGYLRAEDDGGQSFWLLDPATGVFHEEIVWTIDDDFSWPLGMTPDGRGYYMRDSRGRNATALVTYDLETKEIEVIVEDEEQRYDVIKVIFHPADGSAQAVVFLKESMELEVIDERLADDFRFLASAEEGKLSFRGGTMDDRIWLVAYVRDNGPVPFFLYDRNDKSLTRLFFHRDDILGKPLVPMRTISFESRDGYEINGYLTLPRRWKKPGPMVLLVHGGPWTRDSWGYNSEAQWLANRGYACLQVNYRGSFGYGKEFLNIGNREWGGKMQDDLTDAVEWAIAEGIANPRRVAIYGGSYGGYAAYAGATFTPDLYAAAISVVGQGDLEQYLNSIPAQWEAYRTNLDNRVGKVPRYQEGARAGLPKDSSDWTEEDKGEIEFLRSRSPFNFPENVRAPLLIALGEDDFLVSRERTEQFVKMVRENGVEVEYFVFENEGHGLSRPENRFKFYRSAEMFLARHLGGRFEE